MSTSLITRPFFLLNDLEGSDIHRLDPNLIR